MKNRLLALIAMLGVPGMVLVSPVHAERARASVSLTGAGSTFDYPFFTKAFDVYGKAKGVSVNYQPIGSGAGIQQFTTKIVDFGASDVPMNPVSELPAAVKAGGAVEQIPIALGGVAIAYNVPGVKTGLRITPQVLAGMYLGTITRWNDPRIKKLNPKDKLPAMPIIVAHRSDGSGTSYIFTDYLSKVSDQWRGVVGVGKLPNWPVGVGGKGNEGVAAVVQQQPGAVGYVELAYVLQNHMTYALVENKAHQFVAPNLKSVSAAAAQFPKVTASNFSIVNAKGKASYPICGYSWVLLYKHQSDATKGAALKALFSWTATTGQKYAKALDYAPLPKNVQNLAVTNVKAIKA